MAQSISNAFSIRIKSAPLANVPAWVPPPGFFADVPMHNDPKDVVPDLYRAYSGDAGAGNNPFVIWGGSAILRDYSALGAQVYYAGGHEASMALPNVQYSLICDFSTLTWRCANVPLALNIANTFVNGFAVDGTPYCPHTYLGLQELPADWGGGARGSLLSFFWAGSGFENRINVLDVSRATLGYSVFATQQPENSDSSKIRFSPASGGGNYPITVMDEARQGWWVATTGNVSYTLFVARSGKITQYPALGGNLANGSMVLCPSHNLLIAIDGGYSSGAHSLTGHRSIHIRNLVTGEVSRSTTQGAVPALTDGYDGTTKSYHRPDTMGLQWVEELGCVVGLDQSVEPPQIVKLVPPDSDLAHRAWTWTVVPALQHWQQDSGGQPKLQSVLNNVWSKFRWVPTLQAFVYGTAADRKPQVVRIA